MSYELKNIILQKLSRNPSAQAFLGPNNMEEPYLDGIEVCFKISIFYFEKYTFDWVLVNDIFVVKSKKSEA